MREVDALAFDAYGTLLDVRSTAAAVAEVVPERAGGVTEVWRAKQLEYTWLRSLMDRYEDFWTVTRDALVFTLKYHELKVDDGVVDELMDSYLRLEPFRDASEALRALRARPRYVFSNGSPAMLEVVLSNSGLDELLDGVISVDAARVFKPSPRCYALVPDRLGLNPQQVLFVSSNAWDVVGAKSFGFTTAWVRRSAVVGEELGLHADVTVESLADLPPLLD